MHTNTKILAKEFESLIPKTLNEALDLLDTYKNKKIRLLAGGTDLLVKLKITELEVDYLLNIKNIPELDFIHAEKGLKIGAMTSLSCIAKEKKVRTDYTALYEGICSMAAPAIRNMGTLAGNIGNASPAADTVPPLMAYGAKIKLKSKKGERTLSLEDFMIGVGKTLIEPDELITEINLPQLPKNTGSAFSKKSRVKADLSKINLAIYLQRKDDICIDCKIVFGSVAIKAIRAEKTENILKGQIIDDKLINKAAEEASLEIKPIDDIRSTAEYRVAISKIMFKDSFQLAWTRTKA